MNCGLFLLFFLTNFKNFFYPFPFAQAQEHRDRPSPSKSSLSSSGTSIPSSPSANIQNENVDKNSENALKIENAAENVEEIQRCYHERYRSGCWLQVQSKMFTILYLP